jgi:hypothetical protein
MAAEVVDRLNDASAPLEEKEKRKRKLIKGPREFRDMRQDQHDAVARRSASEATPAGSVGPKPADESPVKATNLPTVIVARRSWWPRSA